MKLFHQSFPLSPACTTSGFKSYRPLVGPIETQGSCITAATKSQGAHAMCAAIPQQYNHRHISMSTRYLAVDATAGGCTKY